MNETYMDCSDCDFTWLDAGQDVCPCCGGRNIGYVEDDEDFEGFEVEEI
jgi:hypothetical protein